MRDVTCDSCEPIAEFAVAGDVAATMELFPPAYQLNFERQYQHPLFHPVNQQNEPSAVPDDLPIDDEPLYVNAKQYFRILKRRVARARLEEVHRLSRQRKVSRRYPHYVPANLPFRSRTSTNLATNTPCVVPVALAVAFSQPTKSLRRN